MNKESSIIINSINGVTFADLLKVLTPIADHIGNALYDIDADAKDDYYDDAGRNRKGYDSDDNEEDFKDFINSSDRSDEDIIFEYGPENIDVDIPIGDVLEFNSLYKKIRKNN